MKVLAPKVSVSSQLTQSACTHTLPLQNSHILFDLLYWLLNTIGWPVLPFKNMLSSLTTNGAKFFSVIHQTLWSPFISTQKARGLHANSFFVICFWTLLLVSKPPELPLGHLFFAFMIICLDWTSTSSILFSSYHVYSRIPGDSLVIEIFFLNLSLWWP